MALQRWKNFSSSVKKYFTSECSEQVKYFSTDKKKFHISKLPCNVLFICYINTNETTNQLNFVAKGEIY